MFSPRESPPNNKSPLKSALRRVKEKLQKISASPEQIYYQFVYFSCDLLLESMHANKKKPAGEFMRKATLAGLLVLLFSPTSFALDITSAKVQPSPGSNAVTFLGSVQVKLGTMPFSITARRVLSQGKVTFYEGEVRITVDQRLYESDSLALIQNNNGVLLKTERLTLLGD